MQIMQTTIVMGNRAFLLLRGTTSTTAKMDLNFKSRLFSEAHNSQNSRFCCFSVRPGLPPDLPRLAESARISLTPDEVEEFAPKIHEVVDWFGQLQAVDLQSIRPSVRADTECGNVRDDLPETFKNREAIISAVPNYKEPFIKVPKVLNKE